MLGSAASSKHQIVPGGMRGRWGRDSLPLLPHSPSTTTGDLLCTLLSTVPTPASGRQCCRLPLREWGVAFTVVGRLFLSQAGLLIGEFTRERELLRSVGLQLKADHGGIGRGRWDHYAAVLEIVLVGWVLLTRGNANGGLEWGSVSVLSPVSAPRTETEGAGDSFRTMDRAQGTCSVAVY